MKKNGFTIIELIVVMGLMALIFALSISGIIILGNFNLADRATEELLINLRDSQNRAIAVTPDPSSNKMPIVWGVHIDQANEKVEMFNIIDNPSIQTNITRLNQTDDVEKTDISIRIIKGDGTDLSPLPNDVYFFYSAPFGKFYAASKDCTPSFSSICYLDRSLIRPYDYGVKPAVPPAPNQDIYTGYSFEISLDYKGQNRKITIGANGEVTGG